MKEQYMYMQIRCNLAFTPDQAAALKKYFSEGNAHALDIGAKELTFDEFMRNFAGIAIYGRVDRLMSDQHHARQEAEG